MLIAPMSEGMRPSRPQWRFTRMVFLSPYSRRQVSLLVLFAKEETEVHRDEMTSLRLYS